MAKAPRTEDVESLVAKCPRRTQQLVTALRRLIRKSVPDVIEGVQAGNGVLAYRVAEGSRTHFFCSLRPFPDHVRLGFEYGSTLADPLHLLNGKGKRSRYMDVLKSSDLEPEEVGMLVAEAALVAVNHGRALV